MVTDFNVPQATDYFLIERKREREGDKVNCLFTDSFVLLIS